MLASAWSLSCWNDKVNAAGSGGPFAGFKAKGVHAKPLYSRMGEVTADDGSTLTSAVATLLPARRR